MFDSGPKRGDFSAPGVKIPHLFPNQEGSGYTTNMGGGYHSGLWFFIISFIRAGIGTTTKKCAFIFVKTGDDIEFSIGESVSDYCGATGTNLILHRVNNRDDFVARFTYIRVTQ